ncbi:MAG: VOC family protein [Candidatus Thorarchaeota archaeon]
MTRVIYFEMPVDDFDRATKFYEEIFSWTITMHDRPEGPHYAVNTGDGELQGINGALFKRDDEWSSLVNVIGVKDIDDAIEKIKRRGGEIVFPKTVITGVGYLAYFKDTEGNTFGMMQADSSAN